jgi:hypothetical protein
MGDLSYNKCVYCFQVPKKRLFKIKNVGPKLYLLLEVLNYP